MLGPMHFLFASTCGRRSQVSNKWSLGSDPPPLKVKLEKALPQDKHKEDEVALLGGFLECPIVQK